MGSELSPYTIEKEWFQLTCQGLEFIDLTPLPQEFPM